MPETTDIVAPFDPTAYTSITGAQLLQLIEGAAPETDKGFVIVTTDTALNTPDVPNATITTKWQRYLWLRFSPLTQSFALYVWNSIAGSYLNWTNVYSGTIAADTIKGYMITDGTITADKLAGLIPTSALASGSTFLTSSSVFPTTGDVTGTQSAGLTIQNNKVTNAMLVADTNSGSPTAPVKRDNIKDGEVIVTTKIDKLGAKYQVISNPTAANPAWVTPPFIANGAGLANPATTNNSTSDNGKLVGVIDGSLVGEAGTFGYLKHGVTGTSKNLVAQYVTDDSIDIDADLVVLKHQGGGAYLAETVNLTIDKTNTGANGMDTGAPGTVSTWYYYYVIYNPSTNTIAGLISASKTLTTTSANVPSGYTYLALVGAVYNDASGNLVKFLQTNNRIQIEQKMLFTAKDLPGSLTAITVYDTTTDISTVVPPNAKTMFGNIGASSSNTNYNIGIASSTSNIGLQMISGYSSNLNVGGFYGSSYYEVQLVATDYAYVIDGSGSAICAMSVAGFTI